MSNIFKSANLFRSNDSKINPTPKMQNIGPKEGKLQYSDGSFSKKLQPIACGTRHLLLYANGFKKIIMANPPPPGSGGRIATS